MKLMKPRAAASTNILFNLFNRIKAAVLISESDVTRLMDNYVSDSRNCIPQNRQAQVSAKSNLVKALTTDKLTWNGFITGLRFLGIDSFEITITAKMADGTKEVFSESVEMGKRIPYPPPVPTSFKLMSAKEVVDKSNDLSTAMKNGFKSSEPCVSKHSENEDNSS